MQPRLSRALRWSWSWSWGWGWGWGWSWGWGEGEWGDTTGSGDGPLLIALS